MAMLVLFTWERLTPVWKPARAEAQPRDIYESAKEESKTHIRPARSPSNVGIIQPTITHPTLHSYTVNHHIQEHIHSPSC
jgi:hypothetical protein